MCPKISAGSQPNHTRKKEKTKRRADKLRSIQKVIHALAWQFSTASSKSCQGYTVATRIHTQCTRQTQRLLIIACSDRCSLACLARGFETLKKCGNWFASALSKGYRYVDRKTEKVLHQIFLNKCSFEVKQLRTLYSAGTKPHTPTTYDDIKRRASYSNSFFIIKDRCIFPNSC